MPQTGFTEVRAYVEYLRELGIYDLYRRGEAGSLVLDAARDEAAGQERLPEVAGAALLTARRETPAEDVRSLQVTSSGGIVQVAVSMASDKLAAESGIPKPISFDLLAPMPEVRIASEARVAALQAIRERIGDCTRCPLAYAGRHTIVFGDGDPHAQLMFVGEGPGADEDASGLPFVGKAGQLLNNMIGAMGLRREQVYIANIVKCRPPGNRTPEPVEANTCSQFLLEQIDVVQPRVIVALGSTAATYLLGVKQSLSSLRGSWQSCRGAKVAVTYHPAYLLRDPRQKGEAWKDLQRVMVELGLKAAAKG